MLIVRDSQLAVLSRHRLQEFETELCATMRVRYGARCEGLGQDVAARIVATCIAECQASGLFGRAELSRAVDSLFRHGDPLTLGTPDAIHAVLAEAQARELCSLLESATDAATR